MAMMNGNSCSETRNHRSHTMTEDQALVLIEEAAIALAEPNPDGSINDDRVRLKFEKLLEAADIVALQL
jgi:hypothetical protein